MGKVAAEIASCGQPDALRRSFVLAVAPALCLETSRATQVHVLPFMASSCTREGAWVCGLVTELADLAGRNRAAQLLTGACEATSSRSSLGTVAHCQPRTD